MFYVFNADGTVSNRNPREGAAKLLADFCGGTFKDAADELTDAERAAVAEYEGSVGNLTPRERFGLTEEAAAVLLGAPDGFAVEYSNEHPWKRYDTYPTRAEADKVARFLKAQGNTVRVTPIDPAAVS